MTDSTRYLCLRIMEAVTITCADHLPAVCHPAEQIRSGTRIFVRRLTQVSTPALSSARIASYTVARQQLAVAAIRS